MKRLTVYLNGKRVGSLEQDESGLMQFCYDEVWLIQPNAMPLSRSLPLQSEVFRGKKARPFFAGILPDEDPRKKVAAILGISERNDFAMLERIGGECAGAVSLLPEGTAPPYPEDTRMRELSEIELQDVVAELPRRPLMVGKEGVRLSLAGAQDKLPVVVHDAKICLPLGDTPSSHILKPEPDRFPGLVANEILCMKLASAVGLNVPPVEYRLVGEKACILIRRYDRLIGTDGTITRLHQEDFCQALGFPPERKYQEEGGPLLRDCISLLREWSTAPVVDIRDFIDALIFNVVIGNADAHGKNYSILYRGGERRLSPFYDLVCTLAWPELSKNLAMKIGGSKSLDTLTIDNWEKMAQETRLGWPMIRERISELCQIILEELAAVGTPFEKGDAAMTEQLQKTIADRALSMLEWTSEQG
ncbi:MAG: type II toxin-antitoxin system HipA family toxin [Candidatus Tritonobacter lacicola]|nr:type II toxin-antitoxin system HipA family toxin [Candidatus Tritonobacter lacicola]